MCSGLGGVDDSRRKRLRRTPLPARRILVISYPYPPMPSVGGNRWLAMAKYLRRTGHEVEILTTAAFGALPNDEEHLVHRAFDLVGTRWLRRALSRPPLPQPGAPAVDDTPAPRIVTSLVVPDHCAVTWVPFAVAAARRLLRQKVFDCIVTTSAYESTHLIPLLIGNQRPAWVADFRDGWTFHPWKPAFPTRAQRILDLSLERRVVTTAERTVCVERPVAKDLRSRLDVDAVHVPNGWDPDLLHESQNVALPEIDGGRVLLVHTGKLSGGWGRSPAALLEALRRLQAESPATAERLQLVLAGRLDRAERELIDSFALGDLVRHVGHLQRAQSIALQRRADALVLITAPSVMWELPGKLFEYIGAGRPVLALAAGNEAERVIRETNTGVTVAPDDVSAIVTALRDLSMGRLFLEYAPRDLARYTYPAPANAIADAVEDAIRRRAGG
jgi:glycosyltransferase involved in cell wall biosynthesis